MWSFKPVCEKFVGGFASAIVIEFAPFLDGGTQRIDESNGRLPPIRLNLGWLSFFGANAMFVRLLPRRK